MRWKGWGPPETEILAMNLRTTMTFAIAALQIMEDDGLLQYKCNVGALITRIGFGGP